MQHVIADLTADGEEVDRLVAGLDADRWAEPTPAPGCTIAHQIGHLAFVFRIAGMSAAEPEAFTAMTASLGGGFAAAVNAALADYVDDPRRRCSPVGRPSAILGSRRLPGRRRGRPRPEECLHDFGRHC